MKSRITTYLLIAAAVAVWGFVVWRIFFSKPVPPVATAVRPPVRETQKDEPDFMLLNYPDPFLKNSAVRTPKPASGQPQKPPVAVPKKPAPKKTPPPVKYAGTISTGGRVVYVFEHEGLLHSLSPGDEVAGYTLAAVFPDSVRLAKDGELFTFQMQNAN